jgi:hypothetical protein
MVLRERLGIEAFRAWIQQRFALHRPAQACRAETPQGQLYH